MIIGVREDLQGGRHRRLRHGGLQAGRGRYTKNDTTTTTTTNTTTTYQCYYLFCHH